jgi:hypothetical protein
MNNKRKKKERTRRKHFTMLLGLNEKCLLNKTKSLGSQKKDFFSQDPRVLVLD